MKSSTKTVQRLKLSAFLKLPESEDVGCRVCSLWKHKRKEQWDGSLPAGAVPPDFGGYKREGITFPSYQQGGLLFVGEAPGEHEVDEGVPMVGPAGRIARAAIRTLNLPKPAITNAAICRPMKGGKNRAPNDREIRACSCWLEKAIEVAKPKVIVAMGNHACTALLGREGIHALRGCIFRYKDTPIFVVPMCHPSHVMRAWYSKFASV